MPVKSTHKLICSFSPAFFVLPFFALCCANSSAQVKHKSADTTFLLREITKDDYHAIYIEKNREAKYYKQLVEFTMDAGNIAGYNSAYQSLKQKVKHPFKKSDLAGLPKEWMPLYRYKGKYYLYKPSEWGSIDRRIITDSTIVYWSMEEPYPELLNLTSHTVNTYTFTTSNYMTNAAPSQLIIHIIDPVNKIAVWEDRSRPLPYRYGLYISRATARNFDMIVNYTPYNKAIEFEFDKIDYPALLKHK